MSTEYYGSRSHSRSTGTSRGGSLAARIAANKAADDYAELQDAVTEMAQRRATGQLGWAHRAGYELLNDDGIWQAISADYMRVALEEAGADVAANLARLQRGGILRMRAGGRRYRWHDPAAQG